MWDHPILIKTSAGIGFISQHHFSTYVWSYHAKVFAALWLSSESYAYYIANCWFGNFSRGHPKISAAETTLTLRAMTPASLSAGDVCIDVVQYDPETTALLVHPNRFLVHQRSKYSGDCTPIPARWSSEARAGKIRVYSGKKLSRSTWNLTKWLWATKQNEMRRTSNSGKPSYAYHLSLLSRYLKAHRACAATPEHLTLSAF